MVGGIDQPDDNVTSDLLYHEFMCMQIFHILITYQIDDSSV